IDRVLADDALARAKPSVFQIEIFAAGIAFEKTRNQPGEETTMRMAALLLKRSAENAGQVSDILGHKEVLTHEPLYRAVLLRITIAHPLGELGLHIEGELFLRALGGVMQVAADIPEEGFRLLEGLVFVLGEDAGIDEISGILHAVDIFSDPIERLQVA